MGTPFENFVTLELPKRPTMLTSANAVYDGDPNDGSAPDVIDGAPVGTFYLRAGTSGLYQKTTTSAGSWVAVGAGAGGPSVWAKAFIVAAPTASLLNNVHAGHAASAGNTFSGSPTSPDVPRSLQVEMATGWDGGDVTVTGTNQFDLAVSEVFTTGSNVIRTGVKVFKTVTSIAKATVGASGAIATVGTGDKLGIVGVLSSATGGILFTNNGAIPATLDITYQGFTPSVVADGVFIYALFANVTG